LSSVDVDRRQHRCNNPRQP